MPTFCFAKGILVWGCMKKLESCYPVKQWMTILSSFRQWDVRENCLGSFHERGFAYLNKGITYKLHVISSGVKYRYVIWNCGNQHIWSGGTSQDIDRAQLWYYPVTSLITANPLSRGGECGEGVENTNLKNLQKWLV